MTVPCSLANSTIYREIARRSARFYALRAASGADGSRPIPTFLPKKGLFLQTELPPRGSRFCCRAASPLAAAKGSPEQPLYAVVFLFVRPVRGRTNKKAPSSGAGNDGAKRNKQTAKKAQSKTPKRRRSLLLAGTTPERQTAGGLEVGYG